MSPIYVHALEEGNSVDLFREIKTEEFKFNLKEKNTTTECRNYYLICDDGSLIVLFITYTSVMFSNSIQISIIFYNRERGINSLESENYSASKIRLLDNGKGLEVAGLLLETNFESKETLLKYKSNKPDGLHLKAHFHSTEEPFQLRDGKVFYGKKKNEGTVTNRFIGSCRVHGRVKIANYEAEIVGRATSMHVIQMVIQPQHAINRTWFCYFVSEDNEFELSFLDVETPKKFGKQHYKSGHLVEKGSVRGVSLDVRSSSVNFEKCAVSGYKIPVDFVFTMNGTTFDGKPFIASIFWEEYQLFGKSDVLEHLPKFIRVLVQAFIAKPYIFQWFGKAKMTLKVGDGPERFIDGRLYHEHAITNE
jgi:hypothetical protein